MRAFDSSTSRRRPTGGGLGAGDRSALVRRRSILRTGLGALCSLLLLSQVAAAVSVEESNGCAGSQTDPCTRSGTCEIQGAAWSQVVTIDRADIFDTQGWPGVCDMVHVALVQGRCEPAGAQVTVVAFLSETTSAAIPEIVGPLSCQAEPQPPPVPTLGVSTSAVLATALALWGARAMRRRRCG